MANYNLRVVDIHADIRVESFKKAADFGIWGVIHRASWGLQFTDAKYAQRRTPVKTAGLLWGAYHFGSNENVKDQVKAFLDAAKPDENTLVALDYEKSNWRPDLKMDIPQAREFMERIAEKLGRKPVIYSGHNLKEDLGARADPFFASHRLWLADYRVNWPMQSSWKTYWLHQYTDKKTKNPPNTVPGLPGNAKGNLDCNSYEGTRDRLQAEWSS